MKKRYTTDYRRMKTTEVLKKSASKFSLDMVCQFANSTKTIQINSKSIQIFLN